MKPVTRRLCVSRHGFFGVFILCFVWFLGLFNDEVCRPWHVLIRASVALRISILAEDRYRGCHMLVTP